ncbi:MAG: hypothetical protein PHT72_05335, partial [Candidatus Absconditabacteria bacterium]|nr:hypothetical protein [Candidatus Absconditabacteria bacterium]
YWDAVKVVMKVNKITDVKEGRSKLIEEIDMLKQMYSIGKKFTIGSKEQKKYTIRDDKHARKLLMTTEKYTDDSKKVSLDELWKRFKAQKATSAQRKEVFSALEADACELIS